MRQRAKHGRALSMRESFKHEREPSMERERSTRERAKHTRESLFTRERGLSMGE